MGGQLAQEHQSMNMCVLWRLLNKKKNQQKPITIYIYKIKMVSMRNTGAKMTLNR